MGVILVFGEEIFYIELASCLAVKRYLLYPANGHLSLPWAVGGETLAALAEDLP